MRTDVVTRDMGPRRWEVPATVRPEQRAAIAAKVSGTVVHFPAGLGQLVEKGSTILTLDAPEVAARVDQARARWAEAQRTAERARALTEKGVDAPDTLRDAEDRMRAAQAAVVEMEALASYVTIKAPFAGVVTEKFVLEGDLAVPGSALLVLESTDGLRAEGAMPERAAVNLRLGDPVVVELDRGSAPVTGRLQEISPAADSTSHSMMAKVALPPGLGRSGQFVRLVVDAGPADVLSVPATAVTAFGQMERVFVVEGAHALLRLVKTGRKADGRIEVLGGIEAGEIVVLEPGTLRDGDPVTVRP